jgi:hypothetical protein
MIASRSAARARLTLSRLDGGRRPIKQKTTQHSCAQDVSLEVA